MAVSKGNGKANGKTHLKPTQRRARLFSRGRPSIRYFKQEDLRWMWAAHKVAAGDEPGEPAAFTERAIEFLAPYDIILVIEDENPAFDEGRGPVGLITGYYDRVRWRMEPHAQWFPWATRRNKLGGWVSLLWECRGSAECGTVIVRCHTEHNPFFKRIRDYVPLYPVGKIPSGRPDGDEYLFYLRGRRKRWGQSPTPTPS